MNLVEQLIRTDRDEFIKKETKTIKSAKLSKVLGAPTDITIQGLSGRKIAEILQMGMGKNGERDASKAYDANLMCCVDGIVEPSLKDTTLLEHFQAATPKDLASILFGVECGKITDEIFALSGFSGDEDEEIKN